MRNAVVLMTAALFFCGEKGLSALRLSFLKLKRRLKNRDVSLKFYYIICRQIWEIYLTKNIVGGVKVCYNNYRKYISIIT